MKHLDDDPFMPQMKRPFDWNTGSPLQKQNRRKALDALLDINQALPEPILTRDKRREKLETVLKDAERYWDAAAPVGEAFKVEKGIELLLYDAKRFSEGLTRLMAKADEQKALIEHKADKATEEDRQRYFALLEVQNLARQALAME